MRAGFNRQLITPPIGTRMMGYGNRTEGCKGIFDDLYIHAVALAEGEERLVLVAVDVSAFGREQVTALQRACAVHIPPERLLINTSHTHAGPIVTQRPTLPFDTAYFQLLTERFAAAVEMALQDLKPTTLHAGESPVALGGNRRLVDDSGQVSMGHNPQGPTLPMMTIWHFVREDAADILLFSTPQHGVTMGPANRYISAEWMGLARQHIERERPGIQAVFLQGCAGDQNCWRDRKTYEQVADNGLIAAQAALSALSAATPLESQGLQIAAATAQVPLKDGRNWSIALHGARIGSALLLTLAGEAFVEYALYTRQISRADSTITLGYTQGSEGYLCTDRACEEGGYEGEKAAVSFPSNAPFAAGIEPTLKDTIRRLVESLAFARQ